MSEPRRPDDPAAWTTTDRGGVVVSAHHLASRAGASVLAAGGNAVDAAVATSLALGVCEPAGSGLGGMAVMVLHLAGRTTTISGPCRAPAAAEPSLVAAAGRYRGHAAVATPGAMSALGVAHRNHGRLPFADLVGPAQRLACDGVAVTPLQNRLVGTYRRALADVSLGDWFLVGGEPRPIGDVVVQSRLAATLEQLAVDGPDGFYQGSIAREIDRDHRANGGFLRLSDLTGTAPASEAEPLRARLVDLDIVTVGPPAGGLWLCEMAELVTRLWDDTPVGRLDEPEGIVALAGVISRVRQDRRRYRLEVGAEDLAGGRVVLEPAALDRVAEALLGGSTGETSHICVVDGDGGVVSLTQSLERSFGAACRSPALGFLYNGFLRGFKVENRRHPHYLSPRVPARSNASPAIVFRHGRPWAALGSTGSERATSSILEVLVRLLGGADPHAAVAAPRFHATPDGVVTGEFGRLGPEVATACEAAGYRVEPVEDWAFSAGGLQLVLAGPPPTGVGEPRRDSGAAGPSGAT